MIRLSSCAALLMLGQASCSVDDRLLNYEFHALQAAGASAGGGSGMSAGDAGAPVMNNAGSPTDGGDAADAGHGDAGAAPDLGGSADGGGVSGLGGTGGVSVTAGAGGSTPGSGGALSGGTGGMPAGGAVSAGGSPFACGDLNHDLVDDCTETLVQNSRFDSSVAQWEAEPSLTEAWGSVNASGTPGSGSLSLTNTGSAGMNGARQCIPATPYASYDFAARVQLGAGQTGSAGVNVFYYDDDACHGNLEGGATPIEGGVAGSWTELATTVPLWIPTSKIHSMYVRLVANKPYGQTAPLTVLIDDVLVAKRVMP